MGIYEDIEGFLFAPTKRYLIVYYDGNMLKAKEIKAGKRGEVYDELIKLSTYPVVYVFTESEIEAASKRAESYKSGRNKVIEKRLNILEEISKNISK